MLGIMLIILVGCQTDTIVISDACLVFEPITYSLANDTEETIQQIREHNAAWDSLCFEFLSED